MEYGFKIIEKMMKDKDVTEDEFTFYCEFLSYLNLLKKLYEDKNNLIEISS